MKPGFWPLHSYWIFLKIRPLVMLWTLLPVNPSEDAGMFWPNQVSMCLCYNSSFQFTWIAHQSTEPSDHWKLHLRPIQPSYNFFLWMITICLRFATLFYISKIFLESIYLAESLISSFQKVWLEKARMESALCIFGILFCYIHVVNTYIMLFICQTLF